MSFKWYPGLTIESIEREAVTQAIKYFDGNQVSAARALGISERTIYNKIKAYEASDKIHQVKEKGKTDERGLLLKLHRNQITAAEYNEKMGLSNEGEYLPEPAKEFDDEGLPLGDGDDLNNLASEIATTEAERANA